MLNLVANGSSGYTISNSLRTRASASAYLSRTPATATNQTTWTWSGWVKRGALGNGANISSLFSATNGSGITYFGFFSSDTFRFLINNTTTTIETTQVFRDPSAWYHIVLTWDTTQATASNRVKLYVNGTQVTALATTNYPALNAICAINQNVAHLIAQYASANYFDGYLAEVNFIDGQALTPSSFGSTNSTTGVWSPAKYTGTYGTNGFYLKFSNIALTSGSNTGLGQDFSGNGNYWNTNNISVTAGTTYDAMTDVPTLTSPVTANYCVWNPLLTLQAGYVVSGGNLNITYTSGTGAGLFTFGTIGITSGKWYLEYAITSATPNFFIGWRTSDSSIYVNTGCTSGNLAPSSSSGSISGSTVSVANGDIIGVALDYDNSTCYFYKNNTLVTTVSGITINGATLFPSTGINSGAGGASSGATTFGQRPFTYTPPTGYVALNTYNL
jgi:hypothetical protein